MHTRKYRNAAATCGVIFVNSAFTADDVAATLGFPRDQIGGLPPMEQSAAQLSAFVNKVLAAKFSLSGITLNAVRFAESCARSD